MPHYKRPFFKQKPILYFDENFPFSTVTILKENGRITKHFKIYSAYDFGNQGKDDEFQYSFSKKRGFALVTLDKDFMDDKKFPIQNIPGIIYIVAGKKQLSNIQKCLLILINFIPHFPRPKSFMGDGKFQVSLTSCTVRARDAKTREIKTIKINRGDTVSKIAKAFHYFG